MKRRSFNKTLYNNVYSHKEPANKLSSYQTDSGGALPGLSVYRFVFTTDVAFIAALLLCLSLLLQPVSSLYADELEVTNEEILNIEVHETAPDNDINATKEESEPEVSDVIDEGDDESDSEPVDDESLVADDSFDDPSTEDGETNNSDLSDDDSLDDATSTSASESEPNVSTETETNASSTGTHSTSTPSSADDTDGQTQADNDADDQQEEDQSVEEDETNLSDQTDQNQSDTNPITTSQTDAEFAFNKNECTEVEDGSFYCQKISYDSVAENDLFAAPDVTGDMEIYVIQNGEQLKVTDNAVDDASPYYDDRSETLVWHRLLDDRYQIVSYDVKTGTEMQITDTKVNNMEPTRNGDYTVWQRWVKNNWEIVLLDGDQETQITNSIEHDIAPHIRGDLVIWNVRSSDGTQSLMTYDIRSEIFNEIKDTDGVTVTNPRMLVMYEAQYQNGDTVMKGFDLVTGEIIPIERIPRDLPTEIPSPETTGEVRALPTNPPQQEEQSGDADTEPDTDDSLPEQNFDYESGDLVISATTTATTTSLVEDHEFDLDLSTSDPLETASSTDDILIEQAAIPDVVIPSFEQASSTQDI